MSEKLYKIVEAVDLLDGDGPIPERYLVFMDSDGNQIKEFFPKDRTTLFFQDKLYDWYGREVQIDKKIKRIEYPLGYLVDKELHETFIVELKKGGLTWARLEHNPSFSLDYPYTHGLLASKHCATGHLMLGAPKLKCYKPFNFKNIIPASRSEYLVLKNLDPQGIINVFLKCHFPNGIYDAPVIENIYGRRIVSKVYPDEIRAQHFNFCIIEDAFLLGDITFSENGDKMTTYCFDTKTIGRPDFKVYRISTNAALSKLDARTTSACFIYWYLDPEPES